MEWLFVHSYGWFFTEEEMKSLTFWKLESRRMVGTDLANSSSINGQAKRKPDLPPKNHQKTWKRAAPGTSRSRGGVPWRLSGGEPVCQRRRPQCRGHGFDPWSQEIPHAAEQLGPGTATIELCSRTATAEARVPWDPCSAAGEALAMRSPCAARRSDPCSSQLEKSLSSNKDPAQPKIN